PRRPPPYPHPTRRSSLLSHAPLYALSLFRLTIHTRHQTPAICQPATALPHLTPHFMPYPLSVSPFTTDNRQPITDNRQPTFHISRLTLCLIPYALSPFLYELINTNS